MVCSFSIPPCRDSQRKRTCPGLTLYENIVIICMHESKRIIAIDSSEGNCSGKPFYEYAQAGSLELLLSEYLRWEKSQNTRTVRLSTQWIIYGRLGIPTRGQRGKGEGYRSAI